MIESMKTIRHLENKFSVASYALICKCDGDELRFYLWLKLWAINNHSAWPSYKTITEDLEISERTLPRLLERMEKAGRLKIERKHRTNNVYDITWYDRLAASCSWVPNLPSTTAKSAVKLPAKSAVQPKESNKRIESNHREAPTLTISDFFGNKDAQEKTYTFLISRRIPADLARRELAKFIAYWTEPSKTNSHVRWQGEKYFDVRRRLATWFNRVKEYKNRPVERQKGMIL